MKEGSISITIQEPINSYVSCNMLLSRSGSIVIQLTILLMRGVSFKVILCCPYFSIYLKKCLKEELLSWFLLIIFFLWLVLRVRIFLLMSFRRWSQITRSKNQ